MKTELEINNQIIVFKMIKELLQWVLSNDKL